MRTGLGGCNASLKLKLAGLGGHCTNSLKLMLTSLGGHHANSLRLKLIGLRGHNGNQHTYLALLLLLDSTERD